MSGEHGPEDASPLTSSVASDSVSDPLDRLAKLAGEVESRIPARYRREAFRALAQRAVQLVDALGSIGERLESPPASAPMDAPTRPPEGPALRSFDGAGQELGLDRRLLQAPGKPLLKALLVLQVAADGLGHAWLTPSEIERLLTERGGASGVYRSNLSNALRASTGLVERRQRGRGFEYRITAAGRAMLATELGRMRL